MTAGMASLFLKDFDAVFLLRSESDSEAEKAFRVVGLARRLSQTIWEVQFEGSDFALDVDEREIRGLLDDSKFAWIGRDGLLVSQYSRTSYGHSA